MCIESACLTCFILSISEYMSCPNIFPTYAPILIPLCFACLTENMASLLGGRTLGNRSNSVRVNDVVIDAVEGVNVHYQGKVVTEGSLLLCYASSQRTSRADAEEAHDLRLVSGMISKTNSNRPNWLETLMNQVTAQSAVGYEPPSSDRHVTAISVDTAQDVP